MKTHFVTPFGVGSDRWRTIFLILATLLVWLATAFATLQAQENKQRKVSDRDITSAIEARFVFDDAVPWSFVDVHTHKGIVTLTGTADNLLGRDRATKIAESIKGVRAVVNNITVQTMPCPDEGI